MLSAMENVRVSVQNAPVLLTKQGVFTPHILEPGQNERAMSQLVD